MKKINMKRLDYIGILQKHVFYKEVNLSTLNRFSFFPLEPNNPIESECFTTRLICKL